MLALALRMEAHGSRDGCAGSDLFRDRLSDPASGGDQARGMAAAGGIFLATIAGSITQPIPAGALVLLGVTLSAVIGGLTVEQALAGYADKSVWLVMAAFFISRALMNSGLARRVALFFVRLFGKSFAGRDLRAVAIGHAAGGNDSVELGAIGRSDFADRALDSRTVRIEAGRDGRAAGVVLNDRGLSKYLRHGGDVLYRPGEQSTGGAHGGGVPGTK